MPKDLPLVFVSFCNSDNTLNNNHNDISIVRSALAKMTSTNLCDIIERFNPSHLEIADVFQDAEKRDQIVIFHYGGHAGPLELMMENTRIDAVRFNTFLSGSKTLKLVFLNGCETGQQADDLQRTNIPAVISTGDTIPDAVAGAFAARFYKGLAENLSIREAFDQAKEITLADTATVARIKQAQNSAAVLPGDTWKLSASEDAANWKIGDEIDNPYFGIPEPASTHLPPTPYISLKPYTEKEAAIFWGRGKQIKELYFAALDRYTNPVILLYGQTGVGKSSLMDAGLVPRLKVKTNVFYKRRLPGEGLIKTLQAALGCAGDKPDDFITVIDQLQQADAKMIVLVIDQAEEALTKPIRELPDELERFFSLLEYLLTSHKIHRFKIIIGYRKEYHAEMEQHCMDRNISFLPYFLQPLDKESIREIVNGTKLKASTRMQYRLEIEDGLDQQIAHDLSADLDSPVTPVLQILMTNLWESVKTVLTGKRILTNQAYNELKEHGYALSDFLNRQVDNIATTQEAAVDSGLLLDLLHFFTSPLSTSASHSKDDVIARYDEDLPVSELMSLCVDHYLLTESKDATDNFSLSHDTLAPLVRLYFENSMLPGQKANRILQNQQYDLDNDQYNPLNDNDSTIVANGKKGMRKWTEKEQILLGKSGSLALKLEIQEQTLRNVGMEIHDNIGQVVALLKLHLNTLQDDPARMVAKIEDSKVLVSHIMTEIRSLAQLMTASIEKEGLIEGLKADVSRFRKTGMFDIEFSVAGTERRLKTNSEIILYRVFQEALANIAKHSRAKKIVIVVEFTPMDFTMSITDDGVGFEPDNVYGDGIGLRNMKARMRLITGEILITSAEGQGTKIFIRLPLEKNEKN
jgi:signal transduction histidine kinase